MGERGLKDLITASVSHSQHSGFEKGRHFFNGQ